jgi:threonine dehydrogenase-like Zn-dependent dehydrogenase
VKALTGGGVDAAIEPIGTQDTFASALRSLRPGGGALSSLGVYSGKVQTPHEAFTAGLGDYRILTKLFPGGRRRVWLLMEVVQYGRVALTPMQTHSFSLNQIKDASELCGSRADGVILVAIRS